MIGDFRAPGINNILATEDTSIPENIDVAIECISFYRKMAHGRIINVESADFSHAYKHARLTETQKEFATIISKSPEGDVLSAALRAQPFGSRRSPANWARVTAFVKFTLSILF